jgi:hypothetical protein
LHGGLQLRVGGEPEFDQELRCPNASIGVAGGNPGEWAARMDDRSQKAAGGHAVAKFHAIGDEAIHAQVPGERPKNVVERFAEQNDGLSGIQGSTQRCGAFSAQARLQRVFKVFFAEQVETIASDSAQQRIKQPSGEGATSQVSERDAEGSSAPYLRGVATFGRSFGHSR